jgi:hypothetical protein
LAAVDAAASAEAAVDLAAVAAVAAEVAAAEAVGKRNRTVKKQAPFLLLGLCLPTLETSANVDANQEIC